MLNLKTFAIDIFIFTHTYIYIEYRYEYKYYFIRFACLFYLVDLNLIDSLIYST